MSINQHTGTPQRLIDIDEIASSQLYVPNKKTAGGRDFEGGKKDLHIEYDAEYDDEQQDGDEDLQDNSDNIDDGLSYHLTSEEEERAAQAGNALDPYDNFN